MKVTPIRTPLVLPNRDLFELIEQALNHISDIPEGSVLAVTSKIVSLCEGAVADNQKDIHQVAAKQADKYIPPNNSKYGVMLTIKDNLMAVNAGVDQSNVDGAYVLLPKDPYKSAQEIWQFVRDKFKVTEFGVVITDSTTIPLKWGTVGRSLAHCGFKSLKNMIGEPDLFGRPMKLTQMNITEGLAGAAVLEMGEGDASTPLCLLENIKYIEFQDRPPTVGELEEAKIELEDDVYWPVLKSKLWQEKK